VTRIGAADITAEQCYSSAIDSIVGSLDLYETFDLYAWWEEHKLLSNVRRLDKFIEEILLTSTSEGFQLDDDTIKLWGLDGDELKIFIGHRQYVNNVSFSPDGKSIVSASADQTVKLWNLDGREFLTLSGHTYPVSSAAFSSDGKSKKLPLPIF
jgi:WD40 repeat protein